MARASRTLISIKLGKLLFERYRTPVDKSIAGDSAGQPPERNRRRLLPGRSTPPARDRTPAEARVFLNPGLYLPAAPAELPISKSPPAGFKTAIQKESRLGYGATLTSDGQTATTLLVSSLKRLGAETRYHIPVRASESHGVQYRRPAKDAGGRRKADCHLRHGYYGP